MKGISDLIDSDVEDLQNFIDENSILSTSSEGPGPATKQKTTQPKNTRKRKCVTMPKSKPRVAKASPAAKKPAVKRVPTAKRKALEEKVNGQAASNVHDSEAELLETQPPNPRGRATANSKVAKPMDKQEMISDNEMEVDQTPVVVRSSHAANRSAKSAPKVTSKIATTSKQGRTAPKTIIREAQQTEEQHSDTDDAMDLVEQPKPRTLSRQPSLARNNHPFKRRAGSVSDTERGDPNLRRKLGDVTRRFENVDLKYRNLKDFGINEANANMEKLRKQCEATTLASNELVASLKKELAMQAPTVQDARMLRKQIQTQDAEAVQLRQINSELSTALTSAQNEIKSLQAKLVVARSSSAAAESSRTPAKDAKPTAMAKSAAVNIPEAVQHAQMKEELYSDLTGLIVRGVKMGSDGDTYDCIQTGRNGTLHFKLFIDADDAKTSSFEQTDFLYQPLLDANRDREMIELMPDYLTEEITFSRQDAAKFYGRVLATLTNRRVDE